jgi:predicted ArsR family transcriptional regulator
MKNLREKVLTLLNERGPISIAETSRILDVNKEFLSGYLHGLADSGLLKSKNVGRAKVFVKDDDRGAISQRFSVNTERKQTKDLER